MADKDNIKKMKILFFNITILILLIVPIVTAGSEIAIGLIDYGDGTYEAASISCSDMGCCDEYLEGISNGTWKILELRCFDQDNNFREYFNGEIRTPPLENVSETPHSKLWGI